MTGDREGIRAVGHVFALAVAVASRTDRTQHVTEGRNAREAGRSLLSRRGT